MGGAGSDDASEPAEEVQTDSRLIDASSTMQLAQADFS